MSKVLFILKKTLKAVLWVVPGLVLLFVIIAVLIQIPLIQNKLVHYATSFISGKTHSRVEIKNISISFPKSVVIKGLFMEDLQKDTLLYVGEAKVNIAFKDLLFNKISINNFAVEDVSLNAKRILTDSLFNFNFLLTAFSDTTNQTKVNPQSTSKWIFSVDNVSLKNIRLHYDDKYGGMNAAAVLSKLDLKIEKIDLEKSIYSIDEMLIESINANVLMTKPVNASNNKSGSVLPKITANKIVINNSTVTYGDSISKQSVIAAINQLELKDGSVDLQKKIVSLDHLRLAKSEIDYHTVDTSLSSDSTYAVPIATTESNWNVTIKSILLDENTLAYEVGNKPEIKNAFDSNHLKYNHLKLEATDLFYSSDKTAVSVKKFSATDQNNFSVTKFETDFSMDQHALSLKKLKVETRLIASQQTNSFIAADLGLQYSTLKSLRDSMAFVNMNLDIENASIQNSDVLYFNPQLIKQPFFNNKANLTTFSGIVNGRVNNLKGKDLIIKTGVETVLKTDFTIKGLPDVETAYYDFPNMKINTGKKDIEMIGDTIIPKNIELPENINVQIAFKGKIKSFESTMEMNSSFGSAQLFAIIDKNENFRSKINITSFDLGSLLKDKTMYGPVTLTAEANGKGLDKKTIKAKINAEVSQMYLNKYTYHNLKVDGNVNGQEFKGKINLKDENAIFDFDGLVNLNPNEEHYKFQLNVKGADLQKLNFTKGDLRIGFAGAADLKGGTVNKMNGKVQVSNMIVAKGEKKYVLDSLFFASINQPDKSEVNFRSALIGVKYTGTISPADLPAELNNFISNYFPISEDNQLIKKSKPSNFKFEIQLHNHPILSQILLPELKEFEPGIIKGSFDGEKSDLKLNAVMRRIVYGTIEINDMVFNVNSNSKALNYKISGSSILNSQIKLDNFILDGKLEDKTLFANVSSIADNRNKKIVIHSQITRDKANAYPLPLAKANGANYKIVLDPKDLFLMNNRWDIASDNYIEFGKEGILIHHFFINNTVSQINIASVHDQFNDDLNIAIKNFKLDDISRIVEKDTSLVKGNVDGNLLLKRVNNAYGIIADAKITNLFVRDVPIGNIVIKADNPTAGRFDIDMNLSGNENNMTASGYFIPNGGNNSISIKTVIQSLSMKTIEAFSMGQISGASGTLSGNLVIQGATNAPEITGELVFNNAFFKPMILNSRLELKHETIQFAREGINFKSFTLLDADKHTAIIDGAVQIKQFKDFIFALNINTKDFLLFNSTVRDNKTFYGKMVIDSKIDINGPMTLPVVNGKLKMKKGSNFTFAVPEDKLTTNKGENVVEFENPIKLNSILNRTEKKPEQKSGFTGFDLSSIIEVDKQATLRLLMDPSSTDSLVVKGEATLSFTMDKSGKMSLTGIYNLNEGSYLVSLQSVIKRKFDINQGSTIIWNSDPFDAEISIDATYTARATPYDLVADQMSGLSAVEQGGYKQKYPFLVLLKLRGQILHPVISFEIQLAPKDKGILGGAVNQKLLMLNDDAAALNKQVFALLVLGRFVQENPFQTESGGTSSLVRSTVGSFLSAQLNKLSSKALPGTELNFDVQSYDDYETGQAKGRTQVGIGIKQQLFNERISVQVGGNVDVEGEKASQNSASNITGDVTVEYKLTKDGRFRLKGFRQNRYEGAIEGQLVETGAGVSYVHDFDKWKELFKLPKKKRAAINK